MKPEIWIIDTESPGEHHRSRTAIGPFPDMNAAERYLRKDAEETYLDSDKSLREIGEKEHWAAPMKIVEVRKTVRQVPGVKVTVRLESVNESGQRACC